MIDLCKTPLNKCDSICNPLLNSLNCSCFPGFTLNSTTTCVQSRSFFLFKNCFYEIFKKNSFKNIKVQNVTLPGCSTFNCSQICTLDSNSYPTCKCRNGYSLSSDNKTCSDINECSINNGGCSDTCTNLEGSFSCSCPIGSTLSSNYLTCEGYI